MLSNNHQTPQRPIASILLTIFRMLTLFRSLNSQRELIKNGITQSQSYFFNIFASSKA